MLWIVIWLVLAAKRRWTFKLTPLDAYGITKATTQPLLFPNRNSITASGGNNSIAGSGGNVGNASCLTSSSGDQKSIMSNTTNCTEQTNNLGDNRVDSQVPQGNNESTSEDIYWPKLAPNSPKLKVTFNEVTSTSDDVLLICDHVEQSGDGKR